MLYVIVDIDECAQGLDYCNESNMICINSIRGFTCECAEGYVRQDGACEGIIVARNSV